MIRLVVTGVPRERRTTLVEDLLWGGLPRESRQDLGQPGSMPSSPKAKRLGILRPSECSGLQPMQKVPGSHVLYGSLRRAGLKAHAGIARPTAMTDVWSIS